ncbi:MAG: hypothetical protein QM539_08175 [Alphaproteobacteria bacterium]|nr:hypothetical protein [Alphaproteobacteria bacterium]
MTIKKFLIITLTCASISFCNAQTDTIYTNNDKIACFVKELTADAVKYSFPNEDLINSIYKNAVQKIVFKNGRVQTFAEATSYKSIKSVDDYENVTITQVESEVKGLFKVGEVSSKAKGTTTFSNQERVKERAYRKLKINAAMMGANLVYITNQRTQGNSFGGYFQSGSSAETNLTGVAYTNLLPDFNDFLKMIGDKRSFTTISQSKMWSSASDMTTTAYQKNFTITDILNENGVIIIKGKLQDVSKYNTFRVVFFNDDSFNIYYEDKSSIYNLKISK